MNQEIKKKWVEALRSGKYEQGTSCLKSDKNQFCCLGVLCDIIDPSKWSNYIIKEKYYCYIDPLEYTAYPSPDTYRLANLEQQQLYDLANLNDAKNFTFEQIAQYIEDNL